MKNYFFIFLTLYIFLYISNIYKVYKRYSQFQYLLDKFQQVGNSIPTKQDYFTYHLEEEHFQKVRKVIIEGLFNEAPLINHLLPYSYETFSLNNDGRTTLRKFAVLYDQLQKANYDFEFQKLSCLSPIKPLKQIFLLPSKILSWFGINLNTIPGRIVSAISWFFVYLLKSNATELFIKLLDFIKSLFS